MDWYNRDHRHERVKDTPNTQFETFFSKIARKNNAIIRSLDNISYESGRTK